MEYAVNPETIQTAPPANKWAAKQAVVGTLDPSAEVRDRIDRTISGELRSVQSPWPRFSDMTHSLQPGTVTIVCGDPGCGKSYFVLQWCAWCLDNKETASIMELECDRQFHMFRRLVQLSGEVRLLDPAWVIANGDAASRLQIVHAGALDKMGLCMSHAPNMDVTYDACLKWIEKSAPSSRIIFVDPITAMSTQDKPWIADKDFVIAARKILAKHGSSLVAVTHPAKQRERGAPSMKDLAGGTAYERFTDTILWIRNDGIEEVSTYGTFGEHVEVTCNRRLRLCKTRNGKGAGIDIGMWFDPKSLTFRELGVIVEE